MGPSEQCDISYGESYGEFSEPGFPHNFAKNDRLDLNMGCIDASRRQLQSVLKIRVFSGSLCEPIAAF